MNTPVEASSTVVTTKPITVADLTVGRAFMMRWHTGTALAVVEQQDLPTPHTVRVRRWNAARSMWHCNILMHVCHAVSLKPRADLMRKAGLAP